MDGAALRPARAGAAADETMALLDGEGDVFAEDTFGQAEADSLLGDDLVDRSLSEPTSRPGPPGRRSAQGYSAY